MSVLTSYQLKKDEDSVKDSSSDYNDYIDNEVILDKEAIQKRYLKKLRICVNKAQKEALMEDE
jgi:asparagine synthetase A